MKPVTLANRLIRAAARSGRQVVGTRNSAVTKEFDAEFYLESYPDVKAANIPPLDHYLSHGWKEGRAPAPWFDPAAYLREHPDLVRNGIDPFSHFLKHGDVERARKAGRGGFAEQVLGKFNTDYFRSLVAEAVDLDPMVALPNTKRSVSVITETNKAVGECARFLREHFAGRNAEQQGVADLAGGAGYGNTYGLRHRSVLNLCSRPRGDEQMK